MTKSAHRPPLHAHNKSTSEESRVELTMVNVAMLLATIIAVAFILGTLFGAARMDQRRQRDLQECEEKYSTRCAIVAIPLEVSRG